MYVYTLNSSFISYFINLHSYSVPRYSVCKVVPHPYYLVFHRDPTQLFLEKDRILILRLWLALEARLASQGAGGEGGWYSRIKVKESIKGFSWVGNFPFWVGKFGKYFFTCHDLEGFFGFSKFNPQKSFDQPCHFNSWNPTGLYMYV